MHQLESNKNMENWTKTINFEISIEKHCMKISPKKKRIRKYK